MAADGFDAAAQVAVVTGGGSGVWQALCGAHLPNPAFAISKQPDG